MNRDSKIEKYLLVVCGSFLGFLLFSQQSMAETCQSASFDHTHAQWTKQLNRYVAKGSVNYRGWHSGGRKSLEGYIGALENVCEEDYESWNRRQKMAFWINAYNAYTVKVILEHYPVKSIMKIGSPGYIFNKNFISLEVARTIRKNSLSLNDIENKIIRKQFPDPRIHFGIVCASRSCPPLRGEAFQDPILGRQLGEQTRRFIRDSQYNRYDSSSNTLYLSRIFKWYSQDFQRGNNTIPHFVASYLGGDAAKAIKSKAPQIKYLEYDWSLNGQ